MINKKKALNILLVASEKERDQLASRFRLQEFLVDVSLGGFHCLHLAEINNYQIIIILGDLPDMSANEIISLLKSPNIEKKAPILYIGKEKETLEEVLIKKDLGADEVVIYNENFNIILQKIELLSKS